MIKDALLKTIFIPLLGFGLPLLAGIITYERYHPVELVAANLFFIATSAVIWTGCNWIHRRLRPLYAPLRQVFSRIATVCFVSALYAACTGGLSALIWIQLSREPFNGVLIQRFIIVCIAAVIIFTLVYEILFLTKEREIDTRIVDQLDRERSQAELQALTNEMDPHFIFNSLNTLNHLISSNPNQALHFNTRLAQVYKYFLINKTRELIPLRDELEFINDYFFLLRIRHDEKLQLEVRLNGEIGDVRIPPCALQVLVENAIKHNEFTDEQPLVVRITRTGSFLRVSNNTRPKPYSVHSTGIGLQNLRSRYQIVARRGILVEKGREQFTVRLPLIS